jgi:hypothetical protein
VTRRKIEIRFQKVQRKVILFFRQSQRLCEVAPLDFPRPRPLRFNIP